MQNQTPDNKQLSICEQTPEDLRVIGTKLDNFTWKNVYFHPGDQK